MPILKNHTVAGVAGGQSLNRMDKLTPTHTASLDQRLTNDTRQPIENKRRQT